MLGRYCHRRSAVTFDFGAAGIRAHQFRARGARISLWDALELDLPRSDGADSNEPPVVDIARLARLVEQGRFLGRDVALILSPPDVQFLALHLPEQVLTQEPFRIQQALKCEVSRDMRLDPTNLEVRYWRLPSGHYQGLNVMAIAISVEQATRWFDGCGRHRLNLRRIDVSPHALVGLARRMWTPSSTDLWGILDLGFRRATFTAVVGEVPTYVRCLSASVDDLTRRLSAGLDVSHAIADRLRREYGILPDRRGMRDFSAGWQSVRPEDLPRVLFGLLRGTLDDLVEEINKCFSYVLKSFPDLCTGRLFPSGDIVDQLTLFTDEAGTGTSATKTVVFRFGPYLVKVPPCPVVAGVNKSAIVIDSLNSPPATTGGGEGWVYNPITGEFIANSTATDDEGTAYNTY